MHRAVPVWFANTQTKEAVKVRYGYHLVTDLLKANQSNRKVEPTIIHFAANSR
jgi:hypothetical protein